ncbi:MAG: hypothetical protein PHF60_03570 [Candidatus ainarchaeum sp.]|nr:hypothetical protein [Candidatus ainarchaeum sp.]
MQKPIKERPEKREASNIRAGTDRTALVQKLALVSKAAMDAFVDKLADIDLTYQDVPKQKEGAIETFLVAVELEVRKYGNNPDLSDRIIDLCRDFRPGFRDFGPMVETAPR